MIKATRRAEPTIVVTAVAVVITAEPAPLGGFRVTVVLAGKMLPAGKPLPVMIMLVTPGWPAVGDVVGLSVMGVWAVSKVQLARARNSKRPDPISSARLMPPLGTAALLDPNDQGYDAYKH